MGAVALPRDRLLDPVPLDGGKSVSLKEYFTQKRPTVFFKEGSTLEFFLNSKKWVAWENERRNLAAFFKKHGGPFLRKVFF